MRWKLQFDLRLTLGLLGAGRVQGQIIVQGPPAMPGVMHTILTAEENDMLLFDVMLPAPGATDVVKRELTLTFEGQEPQVLELAGAATQVSSKGPQDTKLTLSLVDIDDAGNRSDARVQDALLADVIPPAQPGEMQIVVTGEEDDPVVPPPVDPVDPPVDPVDPPPADGE